MADINIYGTLNAQTGEGVAVRAAQVKDVLLNEMQEVLNARFNAKINNVSFTVVNETLQITVT